MSYWDHAFETRIATYDYGPYAYTVVYLPEETAARLPFDAHPRLRVEGEITDHPFTAAWQPVAKGPDGYRQPTGAPAHGSHWLIIPKTLLEATRLQVGDEAELCFRIADQDAIDIPDELARALREDETAREVWDALTPGKRRGYANLVSKPKRQATRERKAAEVREVLRGERANPLRRA